jgi:hypothetical protein
MDDCPVCHGRQVAVLATGALTRCACYWVTRSLRIASLLRQGEPMLPEGWQAQAVWPLTSRQVIGSDYTAFRQQAWRSLLAHLDADPTGRFSHVALTGYRTAEIQLQRDEEFRTLRELVRPSLLVLICGVADVNSGGFAAHVAEVVSTMRAMEGQPTWVYATTKRAFGSAQYQDTVAARPDATAADSARRSRRADVPPVKKWRD